MKMADIAQAPILWVSEADQLSESQTIFHLSIHVERHQLSSFSAVTHLSTAFPLPRISMLSSLSLQSLNLLDPLILPYAGQTAHFKKAESAMGLESQNYRMIEYSLLEGAHKNHQLQLLAQHRMTLRITSCI